MPFAAAMDDHQTGNAQILETAGGAIILSEAELNPQSLADALTSLVSSEAKRIKMAKAASKAALPNASAKIASLLLSHPIGESS